MKASTIAGWALLCAVSTLLASCGGGEEVALNERLFLLPSMDPAGASCTRYTLGGSTSGGTGGGGPVSSDLVVSQHSADDGVVVEATEGGRVVAHRVYDAGFFHAGIVDEIVAPSSTGQSLLLRYWGRAADPFCTALELDAP